MHARGQGFDSPHLHSFILGEIVKNPLYLRGSSRAYRGGFWGSKPPRGRFWGSNPIYLPLYEDDYGPPVFGIESNGFRLAKTSEKS